MPRAGGAPTEGKAQPTQRLARSRVLPQRSLARLLLGFGRRSRIDPNGSIDPSAAAVTGKEW